MTKIFAAVWYPMQEVGTTKLFVSTIRKQLLYYLPYQIETVMCVCLSVCVAASPTHSVTHCSIHPFPENLSTVLTAISMIS